MPIAPTYFGTLVTMAVNIKVTARHDLDPATDPRGRTWTGWDPYASDQVNWDHNRGYHTFGPRVNQERYATISFDGRIRLVAELTGRNEEPNPNGTGRKWSLEGRVLPPGDPIRAAFITHPAPTGRNPIEYLPDPDGTTATADAFLLTNNPARWEIDSDELADWVEATAAGNPVEGRWSTGRSTNKITLGDRAFLLRQGVDHRGIFASGRFISKVFKAAHWDGQGGLANYADVVWDTALDPEDGLPIETLFTKLPEGQWEPQASGSQVKPAVVDRLEDLWAAHVASVRSVDWPSPATGRHLSAGQGRRLDAKFRKEIENLAQARLTKVYEGDGWHVEDLRHGNPFDAKAIKGDDVRYLEAKGTVTNGQRITVTRGEVAWARNHPGQCVIGILSNITVKKNGSVDTASGILRRYVWQPEAADLEPLDYDFYPPEDAEMDEI